MVRKSSREARINYSRYGSIEVERKGGGGGEHFIPSTIHIFYMSAKSISPSPLPPPLKSAFILLMYSFWMKGCLRHSASDILSSGSFWRSRVMKSPASNDIGPENLKSPWDKRVREECRKGVTLTI